MILSKYWAVTTARKDGHSVSIIVFDDYQQFPVLPEFWDEMKRKMHREENGGLLIGLTPLTGVPASFTSEEDKKNSENSNENEVEISDEQVREYLLAAHLGQAYIPHRSVGEWLERGMSDLKRAARILRPEQLARKEKNNAE